MRQTGRLTPTSFPVDCLLGLHLEPIDVYVPIKFLQTQTGREAPDSLETKIGRKTPVLLVSLLEIFLTSWS